MFAREVKENADMIASLEGALLYQVDCEKGEGIEIAEKYGIRGYPTFIAMNGQGDVTDRWIGYEGAEIWSASVTAAKLDRRTIIEKEKAFQVEPTLALALALGSSAATGGAYKDAVDYYGKAEELDPDHANEYESKALLNMIYGMDEGVFTVDEVADKGKVVMAAEATPPADKLELAMLMKYMARKSGDIERAVPFLKAAFAASEGSTDEEVVKYRGHLEVDYVLLVEKNPPKALGMYRQRMPEGWEEDAGQLNRFAWWCFENGLNLEEAQELALKGAKLAETDEERANILDTAAEISNALGNCEQALAHIKRAIELDPDKESYKEQLARFEKIAEEKKEG